MFKMYNRERIDGILDKIENGADEVTIEELNILYHGIYHSFFSSDQIFESLSYHEFKYRVDSLLRAFWDIVSKKKKWYKYDNKHYVLQNLYRTSYGIHSKTRKIFFVEKDLSIQDTISFKDRYGFVKFRFFSYRDNLFLLLKHDYGYIRVIDNISEILSEIQRKYLLDYGFDITCDKVLILCNDLYDDIYSVVRWDDEKSSTLVWKKEGDISVEHNFDELWYYIEDKISKSNVHAGVYDSVGNSSGVEFFSNQAYAAYKFIRELVLRAKREVFIIDPYISPDVFELLEIIDKKVSIRVLSMKVQGDARLLANKFQKERGQFELRLSKKFHDRYLFLDDECYLLGASLNSFGEKATTVVPITEESVVSTIRAFAETNWCNN